MLTFTRRDEASPFSYYRRVGARLPGHIDLFLKYGPVYVERRAYQHHLAVVLARYGLFLLKRAPRMRDPDFRDHQRGAVARLRGQVDVKDVSVGAALQLRRMWETRRLRPGPG